MACDPNTLLNQARCFQCLSAKELQQVITYLLCQISTGAGGTIGAISFGHGSPVGVVFPTSTTAIYFDEDTGAQYSYYAGAWH